MHVQFYQYLNNLLWQNTVTYIAKYFGNYIIDFEVEIKTKEELQNMIIEIRNRFTIQNLQIISILTDIELNHYPFSKMQ